MGHVRLDLVGQRFGKLAVVAFAGLDPRRNSRWLCVCECGEQRTHTGANLKRGKIISCGCAKRGPRVEMLVEDHPDFSVFSGMLVRCHTPTDKEYKRYGGRGITVCDRWREGGFWVFIADMGPRPSPDHSIEREDNDGPYSPDNCVWATAKEQGNNRRTNRRITFDGVTLTMSQWAERVGVNYKTLKARIRKGWPLARALDPALTEHGLTDGQVAAIIQARAKGLTMRAVAEEVGVGIASVHKVCTA